MLLLWTLQMYADQDAISGAKGSSTSMHTIPAANTSRTKIQQKFNRSAWYLLLGQPEVQRAATLACTISAAITLQNQNKEHVVPCTCDQIIQCNVRLAGPGSEEPLTHALYSASPLTPQSLEAL